MGTVELNRNSVELKKHNGNTRVASVPCSSIYIVTVLEYMLIGEGRGSISIGEGGGSIDMILEVYRTPGTAGTTRNHGGKNRWLARSYPSENTRENP